MAAATADEPAFLRAVLAAPDDDTVRLVFADFLEQSGEPERAEWRNGLLAVAPLTEG
jgi:uncharacterized protein (TIGR02996 family)